MARFLVVVDTDTYWWPFVLNALFKAEVLTCHQYMWSIWWKQSSTMDIDQGTVHRIPSHCCLLNSGKTSRKWILQAFFHYIVNSPALKILCQQQCLRCQSVICHVLCYVSSEEVHTRTDRCLPHWSCGPLWEMPGDSVGGPSPSKEARPGSMGRGRSRGHGCHWSRLSTPASAHFYKGVQDTRAAEGRARVNFVGLDSSHILQTGVQATHWGEGSLLYDTCLMNTH